MGKFEKLSSNIHPERDRFVQLLISSKYRLLRHLVLIAFIALVMFNSKPVYIEPVLTYTRILLVLLFLLVFYINMYWFAPAFVFKNRYGAYLVAIALMIVVVAFLYGTSWNLLRPYRRADAGVEAVGLVSLAFTVLVMISGSTGIKLFQRSIVDGIRINELEKSTMRSEMEQLKNQINPHFLFNMLNNANVLTQTDPAKASQVLIKLSDLLRYQLYDSMRPTVLLTADIHFLTDFLNLEKIRRDNFEFMISKEGNLSGVQIAPLLLITFVENAIKHNMDHQKLSYVNLSFEVYNEEFRFRCINSKPILKVSHKEVGGLGLVNVKRRLELTYAGKHTLVTTDNFETYEVSLTIQL